MHGRHLLMSQLDASLRIPGYTYFPGTVSPFVFFARRGPFVVNCNFIQFNSINFIHRPSVEFVDHKALSRVLQQVLVLSVVVLRTFTVWFA